MNKTAGGITNGKSENILFNTYMYFCMSTRLKMLLNMWFPEKQTWTNMIQGYRKFT